jgi:PKD repeat protein
VTVVRRALICAALLAAGSVASAPAALADPVVMAAGDIACDSPGSTTPGDCSHAYTSNLLIAQRNSAEGLAAVLAMGDNQYPNGGLSDFRNYFGATWGRLGSLLRPVPGNHEYATSGAAGYFDYFRGLGVPTGARGQGWYSFDVGAWHFVALNSSNGCSPVGCTAGSPQETWLRADLAATRQPCILAYWHHPLEDLLPAGRAIWADLYAAGADAVLAGHSHTYRRPRAIGADGNADSVGPREFIVGTGGKSGGIYGVLKLTLHANSFDWRFVGSGASDSGSATCRGPAPPPGPTASFTTRTSNLTATFTDTSTGSPTSWAWDFGDGSTASVRNPSHAFARDGTYTVRLTATNVGGSTSAVQRITVSAPPPGGATPPGGGTTPGPSPPAEPGEDPGGPPLGGPGPPAGPRLSLPRLSGPFAVGVRSAFVTDPTRTDPATGRARALPVRVWYPALSTRRPAARYLSSALRPVVERSLGLSAGSLDVATRAVERAPARRRIRGIVLLSPEAGSVAALHSAEAADLAGRGYVVVAVDHPHDAAAVSQPGGTLVLAQAGGAGADRRLATRIRDIGVVLARLSRLVPQRAGRTPVAVLGHGLGGSAALDAMLRHRALKAGVDVDGTPSARVARVGLGRPVGLVLDPGTRPRAARFIARLRGPRSILTLAAPVAGYGDLALLDPAGRQAAARTRSFVARFLGRRLAAR